MKIESCSPKRELMGLIKEFVLLSNDSDEKKPIISVDDACYDFMFLQKGTAIINFGNDESIATNLKVYTHQFKPPIKFTFDRNVTYFVIKVQPYANSLFFPFKSPHGIIDLEKNYGNSIIELHENIFKADTFEKKVKISEDFLINLQTTLGVHFNLVKNICNAIYDAKGMLTVNQLSEIFNMDRQSLNKIFFDYVNYTTKKFIILVRILNAIKFKINYPTHSLTEVAYEYGYFDQAHFNYDFKRISGVSPTKLFKDLPSFLYRHKNNP